MNHKMLDLGGPPFTGQAAPGAEDQQAEAQQQQVFCQVLGCGLDLTGGKTYCIKKRACSAHMQAESVQLPGDPVEYRFCQQCGKFESLDKFDGGKRSCRARLAKRRSGTRAQLLKRGCSNNNSTKDTMPDQQQQPPAYSLSMPLPNDLLQDALARTATAGAASMLLQDGTLLLPSERQQLLMLVAQDEEEQQHQQQLADLQEMLVQQQRQLQQLQLQQQPPAPLGAAALAAMAGGGPGEGSPAAGGGHCESSLSEGAAVAVSTAAASAAAATSAAMAAAHHALSAPVPALNVANAAAAQRAANAAAAAAGAAAGVPPAADCDRQFVGESEGGPDDVMTQAELVAAMRGKDEGSGTWHRTALLQQQQLQQLGAAAALPQAHSHKAAAKHVMFADTVQPEASGCSMPLANLCLNSSGLPPVLHTAGSPTASLLNADCKSAPLPRWHSTASGMLPPAMRSASAAAGGFEHGWQQQQQQHGAAGGRLKWLIRQVQEELQTCCPTELESLDNAELSTLLCAALVSPGLDDGSGSGTAAAPLGGAAMGAAAAALAGGGGGSGGGSQMTGLPLAPVRAASAGMPALSGLLTGGGGGNSSMGGPPLNLAHMTAKAELQVQMEQVHELQQHVQQLQLQLAQTKDAQRAAAGGGAVDATQPGARAAAAAAAAAAPGRTGTPPPAALARSLSTTSAANRPPLHHQGMARSTSSAALAAAVADGHVGGLPGGLLLHSPHGAAVGSGNVSALGPGASLAGLAGGGGGPIHRPESAEPTAAWAALASQAQLQQQLQQQHKQQQQLLEWEQLLQGQQVAGQGRQPQPTSLRQQAVHNSSAAAHYLALQTQLRAAESEIMALMQQHGGGI